MSDLDVEIRRLRREAAASDDPTLRNAGLLATTGVRLEPGQSHMHDVVAGPASCATCGGGRLWLVRVRGALGRELAWREKAYQHHDCGRRLVVRRPATPEALA